MPCWIIHGVNPAIPTTLYFRLLTPKTLLIIFMKNSTSLQSIWYLHESGNCGIFWKRVLAIGMNRWCFSGSPTLVRSFLYVVTFIKAAFLSANEFFSYEINSIVSAVLLSLIFLRGQVDFCGTGVLRTQYSH